MPSQGQNVICTLLKKIQMNVHCQFNIHILIFSNQNVNIIIFIKIIKVKNIYIFFSKLQIMLWPWEGIGVLGPIDVNF